jgi:variant SH3 domain-containing protein
LAGNDELPTAWDKIDRYAVYLPVIMSVAIWSTIFLFAVPWLFRQRASSLIWIARSSTIFLALVTTVLVVGSGKGEKDPDRGIIVESAADLKYGPAMSARPIESLRVGETVKLLSKRGEWTFCKARTGAVGWIPTQKVESLVP